MKKSLQLQKKYYRELIGEAIAMLQEESEGQQHNILRVANMLEAKLTEASHAPDEIFSILQEVDEGEQGSRR
jgi:hypothetical protein